MYVTRVHIKNWRNFRDADVSLRERTYLLGANASGKSNFLDVFRFLRDICKPQGGGLQKAIADRGGIPKLRCLHARRDPEVLVEVDALEPGELEEVKWNYKLGFKPEGKGAQRTLISTEMVTRNGEVLLDRPSPEDHSDALRLTQTALEQIQSNEQFRPLVEFFAGVTYLHLVPQLLKYGDKIGGQRLEDDPFGQGFLERVARTASRVRESRLKKIETALRLAVPQFKALRFAKDEATGRPHLEAQYSHHRPNAGWQREDHFSDGTLRLLALTWIILDGDSMILLEEPELSLNNSIVKEVPGLLSALEKMKRRKSQILISTHSEPLLSNPGIDSNGVLLLEPSSEGTKIREMSDSERDAYTSGFSVSEIMLPKTNPVSVTELGTLQ
ncbi:chromosome segregation protein SMC [Ahniella affigens]|uniref:Chromosome segregation protein SMC n=1 Tax=Ahniella affigens TaxID=2021234 RepID=A0A2P1PTX6_9GAMM|nr:AAA family ATPase [Ahniella affigens]AVP98297.1 chromosome segregation protein SMC [Ahniella affigens]